MAVFVQKGKKNLFILMQYHMWKHLFSSYSIGSVQTEMAQKTIVLGE